MSERMDKLKKRLLDLNMGIDEVTKKIKTYEAEIQRLIIMKNATEGARVECNYWIEELKKEEGENDIIVSDDNVVELGVEKN
jgi:hypothetical protein